MTEVVHDECVAICVYTGTLAEGMSGTRRERQWFMSVWDGKHGLASTYGALGVALVGEAALGSLKVEELP